MINYAKVSASGDAIFFKDLETFKGIQINVLDKSIKEVELLLLNKYLNNFGYRPKSFSIIKILASDERSQANLLLTLTKVKNSPCRLKINLQKNEGEIASHIKINSKTLIL